MLCSEKISSRWLIFNSEIQYILYNNTGCMYSVLSTEEMPNSFATKLITVVCLFVCFPSESKGQNSKNIFPGCANIFIFLPSDCNLLSME